MKKFKMSDMKGGWFVGDFEPSVLRTKNFEVGYHTHKKGDDTSNHYHKDSGAPCLRFCYFHTI